MAGARPLVVAFALAGQACGPVASSSQPPIAHAAEPSPPGIVAAYLADTGCCARGRDHVITVRMTPQRIETIADVTLPEHGTALRWFDGDRLAVVGDSGQVYLVEGKRIDRFRMPSPAAWHVPIRTGDHRAEYPSRVHLAGPPGSIELVSCVGYIQGDDDGCVTWAGVPLTASLGIADATVVALERDPQAAPVEHAIAAPAGVEVSAKLEGDGAVATCTRAGAKKQRTWEGYEPCPFFSASTSWLASAPPVVAVTLSSSCGEGPDREAVYLLRACSFDEVEALEGQTETAVYADDLWGHRSKGRDDVPGGSYGVWTVRSGERVVGVLGTDVPPILRPGAVR